MNILLFFFALWTRIILIQKKESSIKLPLFLIRRKFLINKHFQYRFMFFVGCISVMGIIVQHVTMFLLFKGMINSGEDNDARVATYFDKFLSDHSNYFLWGSVISTVAFFLFSLVISLLFSHKIAGPLYRLSLYLSDNGHTSEKVSKLSFREGDFFQELPRQMNAFTEAKNINKPIIVEEESPKEFVEEVAKVDSDSIDENLKDGQ